MREKIIEILHKINPKLAIWYIDKLPWCTFEQYLIDVGVRSSEYNYDRYELIKHIKYFKKCWKRHLSAYKALLFLCDEIKDTKNNG